MNWIDYWYLILVVPALLVALFAQVKVQSTFKKYSQIGTRSGLSGAEASMNIQRQNGIRVPLEQVKGSMTDHYDPRANVIRLSETVYGVRSIAAITGWSRICNPSYLDRPELSYNRAEHDAGIGCSKLDRRIINTARLYLKIPKHP